MADLQTELAHLAQVDAHIAGSEMHVAKLERLVAMFGIGGGDTSLGRQTLELAKDVLVTLRASRVLVLATIDDIEAGR